MVHARSWKTMALGPSTPVPLDIQSSKTKLEGLICFCFHYNINICCMNKNEERSKPQCWINLKYLNEHFFKAGWAYGSYLELKSSSVHKRVLVICMNVLLFSGKGILAEEGVSQIQVQATLPVWGTKEWHGWPIISWNILWTDKMGHWQ